MSQSRHRHFTRTILSALLLGAAQYSFSAPACPPRVDGLVLCPGVAGARDHFIEARIRALPGGDASGRLVLLGRYVDADNWIGAALNITDASATVHTEILQQHGGSQERFKQVKRSIVSDGRWHTLRFEMIGQALSVYLNGEKLSTLIDPAFAGAGQLGLLGKGKAFEVRDVRVGDPAAKPMRIAPALAGHNFKAQAGDPAAVIAISAFAGDGLTRERFTATSSDPSVAAVSTRDGAIEIKPGQAGSASITVASVSDPTVYTIIDARIAPAFVMPAAKAALNDRVTPAANAANIHPDTPLRLRFEQPVALGAGGSVRIYRKADNALIDVIRLGDEVAALGHPGQDQRRMVRHTPITVDGKNATIMPHAGRLAYGTAYYVVVEAGVFDSPGFQGIGKAAGWTFRTRAAAPKGNVLTVDDDGPADFRTVQGALNHVMQHVPRATAATIAIRNGRYHEMLFIRGKDNLTLKGQSRDGVLIHSGNNDGYNPGSGGSQPAQSPSFTGGRSLMMVEDADLLTLDTLTMKNTTLRSDKIAGQAETVYFNTDSGRLIAKNASFFSEQDTIQVKGYSWFYRTLIEGNVDFIWGANRAALFEESELRSVGDSANRDSGGYVVQARTVSAADPGFVFLNSALTHGAGPAGNPVPAGSTYLARSPGTAATWDNVSYINCRMDGHVAPVGWAGKGVQRQPAPNPVTATAVSGWREYGSMDLAGKPLDLSQRVGGRILTADEAKAQFGSRAQIFAGFGEGKGWNPQP